MNSMNPNKTTNKNALQKIKSVKNLNGLYKRVFSSFFSISHLTILQEIDKNFSKIIKAKAAVR